MSNRFHQLCNLKFLLTVRLLSCLSFIAFAQTTRFSEQGKLSDGERPANASYEKEFRVSNALREATQQGAGLLTSPAKPPSPTGRQGK